MSLKKIRSAGLPVRVDRREVMLAIATLTCMTVLFLALPALAHHPFGGETPNSPMLGLLSGLGHPVIGLDHLIFIVLVGILGAQLGPWIPAAFLAMALAGTGIHLLSLGLPAPEFFVALSVLVLGGLLAGGRRLGTVGTLLLAAGAGLFHGYAYGEAIVGAEVGPLLAYLVGFTAVQGAIALGSGYVAQQLLNPVRRRYVGFTACGAGAVLLASLGWG